MQCEEGTVCCSTGAPESADLEPRDRELRSELGSVEAVRCSVMALRHMRHTPQQPLQQSQRPGKLMKSAPTAEARLCAVVDLSPSLSDERPMLCCPHACVSVSLSVSVNARPNALEPYATSMLLVQLELRFGAVLEAPKDLTRVRTVSGGDPKVPQSRHDVIRAFYATGVPECEAPVSQHNVSSAFGVPLLISGMTPHTHTAIQGRPTQPGSWSVGGVTGSSATPESCLLYTSDAADE